MQALDVDCEPRLAPAQAREGEGAEQAAARLLDGQTPAARLSGQAGNGIESAGAEAQPDTGNEQEGGNKE